MELVVGLTKYVGLADPRPTVEAWVAGYAEGSGAASRLTARELAYVPGLLKLRIENNVAFFIGRWLSGEDSLEPLTGRADTYRKRCEWVDANAAWLVGLLEAALLEKA